MEVLPRIPDSSEIRRELDLVLASPVFRGSKRCQDFLRFAALKVLAGDAGELKERTLAVEVFGRRSTADLGDDSIVRVGAREVRKRLAQYYVTEGAHDAVRIDLPPGSYVPVFHFREEAAGATASATVPAALEMHEPPPLLVVPASQRLFFTRSRLYWIGAVCAAFALALAARYLMRRADPFYAFWQPMLAEGTPVTMVLPHPIVYHPSSHASELDLERNGPSKLPVQRAIQVPPGLLSGSDFVPVLDQYVGFGDAVAAFRMSNLLARYGREPKFRLASKLEFSDLRDSSPILIGAFTNRWTAEITRDMRFHFATRDGKPGIVDTKTGRLWSLASKMDNGRSAEDYLLIGRLPHSQTGGPMMIGAGINVYGTEEAGRILSDPQLLKPILRQLPEGWRGENLELILHVEVVGEAPALPRLVASQLWKP